MTREGLALDTTEISNVEPLRYPPLVKVQLSHGRQSGSVRILTYNSPGRLTLYRGIDFTMEKGGNQSMRIGEVAANAGVNVQTVRYYESRGLLPKPSRLPSGYRVYQAATPELIRFIKRAQAVGFTLRELKDLLRLTNEPLSNSRQLRSVVETKIDSIDEEIRRLTEAREFLSELLTKCGCLDPSHGCIIRIPQ